jgi:hypothetical protein
MFKVPSKVPPPGNAPLIGMLAKGSTTCGKTSLGQVEKRETSANANFSFPLFSLRPITYRVQAIKAIGMPSLALRIKQQCGSWTRRRIKGALLSDLALSLQNAIYELAGVGCGHSGWQNKECFGMIGIGIAVAEIL